MNVLIADDSGAVRERLKILLAEVEAITMIREAENVQQAMEEIRQRLPDVIILDIRMPDGNGMDVLRQIEKRGRVPVVIMLTSYPHPQYRSRCLDAGADFFFDKTAEFEKVVEVLVDCQPGSACNPGAFS